MKKDKEIAVDEFFRQREAGIPVRFDREHWEQLAAALDAAHPEQTPPTVVAPQPSFGKTKGWWVSGIWIFTLVLCCAWIVWQSAGVTPVPVPANRVQSGQPGSDVPATGIAPEIIVPDMKEKTGAVRKDRKPVPVWQEALKNVERGAAQTPETGVLSADSLQTFPVLREDVSPDTTVTAPKKRKKHIFW